MTATDDTDYVKLLAEMLDTLDVSAKPIAVGYEEYGAHFSLFGPLLGVSITEKSLFPWKGSGGDGCIDILFLNTTQISQVFNQCAMGVYSGLAAADLVEKEISSVRSLISESVSKTPIGQAEKTSEQTELLARILQIQASTSVLSRALTDYRNAISAMRSEIGNLVCFQNMDILVTRFNAIQLDAGSDQSSAISSLMELWDVVAKRFMDYEKMYPSFDYTFASLDIVPDTYSILSDSKNWQIYRENFFKTRNYALNRAREVLLEYTQPMVKAVIDTEKWSGRFGVLIDNGVLDPLIAPDDFGHALAVIKLIGLNTQPNTPNLPSKPNLQRAYATLMAVLNGFLGPPSGGGTTVTPLTPLSPTLSNGVPQGFSTPVSSFGRTIPVPAKTVLRAVRGSRKRRRA